MRWVVRRNTRFKMYLYHHDHASLACDLTPPLSTLFSVPLLYSIIIAVYAETGTQTIARGTVQAGNEILTVQVKGANSAKLKVVRRITRLENLTSAMQIVTILIFHPSLHSIITAVRAETLTPITARRIAHFRRKKSSQ